jgi:hypothetical protein
MERYDCSPTKDYANLYLQYKLDKLNEHREYVQDSYPRWIRESPNRYAQSWKEWRESSFGSQMELCKTLLINPAILQNYETRITKHLPVVIRERLLFFGMKPEYVTQLTSLPMDKPVVRS